MGKIVYCHVGVRRAGSSFLQTSLALNRSTLATHDVSYIDKYQFGRTPSFTHLQNLWEKDMKQPVDFETAHADFQSQLQAAKCSTVLLSHENLLGRAFSGNGFYPDAETLIDGLQRLAHPSQLRIILCLRNQVDFIESIHFLRIMVGKHVDLDKYLAKLRSKRRSSWLDLLVRLEGVVGRSQLLVVPFELIYESSQNFLKAFLSLAGVTVEQDLVLSDKRNASPSEAALRILAFSAQLLDRRDQGVLRLFLQEHFPPEKYGRPRILDDEFRLKLRARFSADNRRMLEQFVDSRFVTDKVRSFYCAPL